jgi:hypothetical protein
MGRQIGAFQQMQKDGPVNRVHDQSFKLVLS